MTLLKTRLLLPSGIFLTDSSKLGVHSAITAKGLVTSRRTAPRESKVKERISKKQPRHRKERSQDRTKSDYSQATFLEFRSRLLPYHQKITLGDGRTLEAVGTGVVELKLKLPDGETKIGRLSDVLYVPTLSYNLLSVPKTTEAGNTVRFGETHGEFTNSQGEVLAVASKAGGLYYLNCEPLYDRVNVSSDQQSKEKLWHRRFGHLGTRNMNKLKKSELVDGFDYTTQEKLDFCKPCVSGKIHRSPFPKTGRERATEPLGIVHSDVCGKISSPSLGQAEYFVVFIDDKTHYVWISVVKHKHEVFQSYLEWKALVEKSSGYRVKKF